MNRPAWIRPMKLVLLAGVLSANGCESGRRPAPVPMPPTVVTVARPLQREVQPHAILTGRTDAVESVEVRARVGGFLESIHFQEGQEVKTGDLLFEIDRRTYDADLKKAQAALGEAEAQLKRVRVDYDRLEQLIKQQDASPVEWERSRADKVVAEAAVEAAKADVDAAQLYVDYTRVTSPINGRIGRAEVTVGNLIQGGAGLATRLTTIVSQDPMYVYFDVDERGLLEVQQQIREKKMPSARSGDTVPVFLGLALDKGYPHVGALDYVSNRLDPTTGTLQLRGVFENDQRILSPGLFSRVRLNLGYPRNALMVTERALGFDQGNRYLLVVGPQNKVEYRQVQVGIAEDGLREIADGVSADDWVIVNGLQRVRPGIEVKPEQTAMTGTSDSRQSSTAPPSSADSAAASQADSAAPTHAAPADGK